MGSLVIGLMSGTSLDGVDAALVDFSASPPRVLETLWTPYTDSLRLRASSLQVPCPDEIHDAAQLANELAHAYAATSLQLLSAVGIAPSEVSAIGCHGQTIRHRPASGYSLQINNAALLSELTGITVIADFRSRDIAAGGQGAPLVPAFHAAAFSDKRHKRCILNLGGIANLTSLIPGQAVTGFDCGPGNLLMDAWIERHKGYRYDQDGKWAASGAVHPTLLAALMSAPFLAAAPPKSCGREEFSLSWLDAYLEGNERPEDIQATLLEFTAQTIAQAIKRWCKEADQVITCGGGAHNAVLMARLAALLPNCHIASTDSVGLSPDWVEAVAFAWLAWQTLHGKPGNLPEATGARGPRILGAIYQA